MRHHFTFILCQFPQFGRLTSFQRRANFSAWLQRQNTPAAAAALLALKAGGGGGGKVPGGGGHTYEAAIAQLLTAHQTAAAAALAAAAGDVRLATLIAQSGRSSAAKVRCVGHLASMYRKSSTFRLKYSFYPSL